MSVNKLFQARDFEPLIYKYQMHDLFELDGSIVKYSQRTEPEMGYHKTPFVALPHIYHNGLYLEKGDFVAFTLITTHHMGKGDFVVALYNSDLFNMLDSGPVHVTEKARHDSLPSEAVKLIEQHAQSYGHEILNDISYMIRARQESGKLAWIPQSSIDFEESIRATLAYRISNIPMDKKETAFIQAQGQLCKEMQISFSEYDSIK